MAYTQNSPFNRKSPLKSSADEFMTSTQPLIDNIRQDVNEFAGYRGRDTWADTVQNAHIRTPYAKDYGYDKKYPYLSSRHHTMNSIHNPMKTTERRPDIALTVEEQRKRDQDYQLTGKNILEKGTRGSTLFGREFNKKAEKDAKQAVKRHEYLSSIAGNEEALRAALSTEKVPNKFGVMINQEMPVREQFPMVAGMRDIMNFNLPNTETMRGPGPVAQTYANNPEGHSLRNIHNFQDLRDRASAAQDLTDRSRQFRDAMRFMDPEAPSFNLAENMRIGYDPRSGEGMFDTRIGRIY